MFLILFILTLLISVVLIYLIWHQAKQREQKLRKEILNYRYRRLKNQINPHFLFNSLNTISEMLSIDVDKTDLYVRKLIEIYHFILQNEDVDLIIMEEELKFVRQYFKLEKEREKERNALAMEVEDFENHLVIPVSVQKLIENALKQNSPSAKKSLIISVKMENGYMVISNKITNRNRLEIPQQTGVLNLHDDIKLVTGGEIITYQEDGSFVVSLPLIKA